MGTAVTTHRYFLLENLTMYADVELCFFEITPVASTPPIETLPTHTDAMYMYLRTLTLNEIYELLKYLNPCH